MRADLDLAVLGGGCAGLSLAERLAEQAGPCRRVAVLEPRTRYSNDRSWCFWRLAPHRHDALVKHRWSQIGVRSPSKTVRMDCTDTPYQLLEARAFYDQAQRAIAASEGVRLHTGVVVLGQPRPVPGGWRIETSTGALTAAQVIDTRPRSAPRRQGAGLWQSFLGQEVICDRPAFDPRRVELMDFAHDAPGVLAFTYVLPLAPDRALVETTLFDPQPHSASQLIHRQQQAVRRWCGDGPVSVVRTESGMLPMGTSGQTPDHGPGYACAGLVAGAARPATGYAFQRIQSWADRCSDALRQGQAVQGHPPDPLLMRLMDRLFLDVLRAHPERGPELFTRLFERVEPARVVRFLSDQCRLTDRVAVAACLPTGLFLRQLMPPALRQAARVQTS